PILIIEDEHALASALRAVCARIGRDATLCASGQSGIGEAAAGDYALLVVDIGLPDMSGFEALEKIRAGGVAAPVLIITAHGNFENAVAAKKHSAEAYLVKPLDLAAVERTMRQLLDAAPAMAAAGHEKNEPALFVGASARMQRSFMEIAHACV